MQTKLWLPIFLLSVTLACGGGDDGADSSDSADGKDSSSKTDGTDADDGSDAKDASDSSDGKDKTDGTDKTDASDESDKTDGSDKSDNSDSTDGTDATDGSDKTDATDATDSTTGQTPAECIQEKCSGEEEALVCDNEADPPATYKNACEAECSGADSDKLSLGSCEQGACDEVKDCASKPKEPWCDKTKKNDYANKCFAQCAGVSDAEMQKGTCKELCPQIEACETKAVEPYCYKFSDSENNEVQKPYANLCFATCDGLEESDLVKGKCPDVALPCDLEMECAKQAVDFVCDDVTGETFKNDCYLCCARQEGPAPQPPQLPCVCADAYKGENTEACFGELSAGVCAASCPNIENCSDEENYPKDNNVVVCDPVEKVTYENTFWACCNGKDWLKNEVQPGECESDCNPEKEDCGCVLDCPAVDSPLCASKDNEFVQHANSCKFQESITYGDKCDQTDTGWETCAAPCGDLSVCGLCSEQTQCEPVCGKNGVTYFNSCFMTCAGVNAEHEGPCCKCDAPTPDTIVCSKAGNTWGNECELNCMGESFHYKGECVPGCNPNPETDPLDGVCGVKDGKFSKFVNASCAEGAGATCIYEGECTLGKNECQKTNTTYAPVCAKYLSPNGDLETKSLPNKCHAGCKLAESQVSGLCQFCSDQCADAPAAEYCDPVTCITYPNLCVPKKCLEIEVDSLVKGKCSVSLPNCGKSEDN